VTRGSEESKQSARSHQEEEGQLAESPPQVSGSKSHPTVVQVHGNDPRPSGEDRVRKKNPAVKHSDVLDDEECIEELFG
jgi:hypothetical protein